MVDEITNPHFSGLQQAETLKDIIQSEFKIKTTQKTPFTFFAMSIPALLGILGIKIYSDKTKDASKTKKTEFINKDNYLKISGIGALSILGVILSSKLFNRIDIRKLKTIMIATGNETPKSWGNLDDIINNPLARRIVRIKIDKVNPSILSKNFADMLKKVFPNVSLNLEELSKQIINKYSEHLNYSTLQDGYFIEFLKGQFQKSKDMANAIENTIEQLVIKSKTQTTSSENVIF